MIVMDLCHEFCTAMKWIWGLCVGTVS